MIGSPFSKMKAFFEVNKLQTHWAKRIGLLRSKWSKLNQAPKQEETKEAFLSYKTAHFTSCYTCRRSDACSSNFHHDGKGRQGVAEHNC